MLPDSSTPYGKYKSFLPQQFLVVEGAVTASNAKKSGETLQLMLMM